MIDRLLRDKQQNFFLILILGALDALTPFSIDMYLPAFPEISHDLKTSLAKVSFSVSSYFIGFAIGQIFYGPLLDRFGRKRPMYGGLALYIVAAIGCMMSQNIEALIIFRFIQAFGGCVASVAAVAMVHDFFPVSESAKIFSLMILILGISPLLAPTVGSFIVASWGWQFVFGLLSLIAIIIFFVVFFILPEGHAPDPSSSLKPLPILNNFKSILLAPQFYVYMFAGSFSFAGLFVYVTGSPEIFMDSFQVSAKIYGIIFAVLSIGFIGASQANHILTHKYSSEKIFKPVLIIQVIASIIFFIGACYSWYGLIATMIFLFILLSCMGLAMPNATALALAPFSKNAGSASALAGFLQIGLGALMSSAIGILHFKGAFSTAIVMAASSLIALIILLAGKKKIKEIILSDDAVIGVM